MASFTAFKNINYGGLIILIIRYVFGDQDFFDVIKDYYYD